MTAGGAVEDPRGNGNDSERANLFDAERFKRLLDTEAFGRAFVFAGEIDSTQRLAAELAAQGAAEGTVVLAERQTAGKGRMGRSWHSPSGKGLWFSLILRPTLSLKDAPFLTFLAAAAVCRSIRRVAGVPAAIKWPNDILVDGRKVCGILMESQAEEERIRQAIAGIGIDVNLSGDDYPADIRAIATSLRLEAGQPIDREELLADVLKELEQLYRLFHEEGSRPILALWEALNCTVGRRIRMQQASGIVEGTAEAIAADGALVVRLEDGGELRLHAGEIHHPEPAAGTNRIRDVSDR